jgi:hypothetical protein
MSISKKNFFQKICVSHFCEEILQSVFKILVFLSNQRGTILKLSVLLGEVIIFIFGKEMFLPSTYYKRLVLLFLSFFRVFLKNCFGYSV